VPSSRHLRLPGRSHHPRETVLPVRLVGVREQRLDARHDGAELRVVYAGRDHYYSCVRPAGLRPLARDARKVPDVAADEHELLARGHRQQSLVFHGVEDSSFEVGRFEGRKVD
jgi:hypothetical protein